MDQLNFLLPVSVQVWENVFAFMQFFVQIASYLPDFTEQWTSYSQESNTGL